MMNDVTTLLVEIERPVPAEPLYLMCGRGFSVLRTDITGRDLYGFAHDGKEYLLFPFSFAKNGGNTLSLNIPSTYEEWFMDMDMNGARIRFASPHGEPLFTHMAEEYRSGSGVLSIDAQGGISVTMDKADPSQPAAHPLPERGKDQPNAGYAHHSGCACGQEHSHDHHAEAHVGHRHEQAVRLHLNMSDHELTDTVRKRVEGLNLLLLQAAVAGLEVDMAFAVNDAEDCDTIECPQLFVKKIARLL